MQEENREAPRNLDEILAVEGVDGVFIGSAPMGYRDDATHRDVQSTIEDCTRCVCK